MAFDLSMPILVVDDYSTMIRIIRNLLKQLGFENVDEASDGSAALAKDRPARAMGASHLLENWRAESALFLLARKDAAPEPPAERRSADRLL